MPPVLVPAIISKQSPMRRVGSLAAALSLASSTVRMRAGIRPRMPPPSMDRMRKNLELDILPPEEVRDRERIVTGKRKRDTSRKRKGGKGARERGRERD